MCNISRNKPFHLLGDKIICLWLIQEFLTVPNEVRLSEFFITTVLWCMCEIKFEDF